MNCEFNAIELEAISLWEGDRCDELTEEDMYAIIRWEQCLQLNNNNKEV